MTVSSALIAPQADRPLTPAMVRVVWQIAAELDRARVPVAIDQAVWVQLATAEVRGDSGRDDNGWLRQALRRLSGVTLSGETRAGKWGAVLVAQWEIVSGGSVLRVLVPPAAVAAMRAPETFAKLDSDVVYKLPPHGQRLYAIVADRLRQARPYAEFTLDELRAAMGVDGKESYKVWSQLRKWVLDPAVAALNDAGAVHVSYSVTKLGRAVNGVTLRWRWRDPVDAAAAADQTDRHSLAAGKPTVTNAVSASAPPLMEGDDAAWAWSVIERVLGAAWAKAWGPQLTVTADDGVVRVSGSRLAVDQVQQHGLRWQAEQELRDAGWHLEVK